MQYPVFRIDADTTDKDEFERRRHRRRHEKMRVVVGSHTGEIRDLSVEGAQIVSRDAPARGEVIEVVFELKEERVRAMCVVRWVARVDEERCRFGVQFVWVPDHALEVLRAEFSGRCAA